MFLIIILVAMAYAMVGGTAFARFQAIESSKCGHRDCWDSYNWCRHSCFALFAVGPLWPVAIPALIGMKAGGSTKETRDESRRARELAEADHKIVLAKKRAQETLELERVLD